MKLFNAIQTVALFTAMPFILSWLSSAEFKGAGAAWWGALVFYIAMMIVMIACVRDSMRDDGFLDW